MNSLWAVFKRELRSYFTSPIAYTAIAIFLFFMGLFFSSFLTNYYVISLKAMSIPYGDSLNVVDMVLQPFFLNTLVVMLLVVPLITMRLFAEEKKSGTLELLLSYPIRDLEVLLGKYLAAFFVFALMVVLTGLYQLILLSQGLFEPGVVLSGYVGLLLAGAAFLALGLCTSSLTENQVVAGFLCFGGIFIFWVAGVFSTVVKPPWKGILEYISMTKHMLNFSKGVIDTADIAYLVCFSFFFLLLTLRILEARKWRG